MRFSLCTAMVVVVLITVAIAWYLNWRRANIGVQITVPAPLGKLECEVPGFFQEYAYGAKVREHKRNHPPYPQSRIASLRKDFLLFSRIGDGELLKSNKDELVQLARTAFADEASSFKAAANAAWILNYAGDSDAYRAILNRLKEHRAQDDQQRWQLFDIFPSEKLVTDPELLKLMKASVGGDTSFARRSEYALFKTGIDRRPWVQRKTEEARLDFKSNDSIRWLIDNSPSIEALELAENYLFNSPPRMYNSHLVSSVLKADFSMAPELQEIADRIERKFIDLIRDHRSKQSNGFLDFEYRSVLVHRGTIISKEYFFEVLDDAELEPIHSESVEALIRLGLAKECRAYMQKAVFKLPSSNPHSHLEILNLHEQCCGREASIEVCSKLAENDSNFAACQKLAALFEDTHDPGISNLILKQLFRKGKGPYAVEALELLEQIGNSNLSNLWAKLPESKTSDPLVKFYQHWYTQGMDRAEVVNWINQTLQPENPISVDSVLNESKFFSGGHYLWRFVHEGFNSHHKFTMAALAHSGSGDLAFGEDMYFVSLVGYISELASTESTESTESSEMKVHSTSSQAQNGRRMFGIVVNHRLYEFTLKEPEDNYENRYDARAIVEILNAIAIRQRLSKRFFAYPTEWDTGFCLVLFIEPELVAELEKKFGLVPIDGCEFYLQH